MSEYTKIEKRVFAKLLLDSLEFPNAILQDVYE